MSFTLLSQLDSVLTITLYDYHIESTFFTFIIIYILSAIIGFIGLKITFLLLDLPFYIKRLFLARQVHNINGQLIKALGTLIMGDKAATQNAIKRIKAPIKSDNQIFYTLLLAETSEDQHQQIKYFQELEQFKLTTAFATKRLGQIFYQKKMYKEAENYAIRSFYLNEYDTDTLEMLIDCYFKLFEWEKLTFIISKFNRINPNKFGPLKNKLANYYTVAAKDMLASDDTKKAIYYLEIALQLVPSHYEALSLYCTVNYSIKQNLDIKILENAFTANPTLEIAALYQQFTSLPPAKIYEDLATLVSPEHHIGLFRTIAAFLNVPDQVQYFQSTPDLIPGMPKTLPTTLEVNQKKG
ncbi:tetratricopeptide repeat protein [Candidatus Tisiphia endosymbiont of Nemotelus uliginosus]|uniref:tetratricopeptide repeat protein n=1 Tax=Candidatus Tisiphia endosymbiont of Nemotelus uliginosus TaxID=3077926 RepID=UPI0035C8D8D1